MGRYLQIVLLLANLSAYSAWISVPLFPGGQRISNSCPAKQNCAFSPCLPLLLRSGPRNQRSWLTAVLEAPSVRSRRKRAEVAVPRVPRNFTTLLETMKNASESKQKIRAEDCKALLSHLASSAGRLRAWVTVDRALEVCHIMTEAGLKMDETAYR
jgi:hypothetical protein